MNNQAKKTLTNFDNHYWQKKYSSCPYIEEGASYEDYQSAYQTGHEGYDRYSGKSFDEAEAELKLDYEKRSSPQGGIGLAWDKVKDAVRDAWDQAGTT